MRFRIKDLDYKYTHTYIYVYIHIVSRQVDIFTTIRRTKEYFLHTFFHLFI